MNLSYQPSEGVEILIPLLGPTDIASSEFVLIHPLPSGLRRIEGHARVMFKQMFAKVEKWRDRLLTDGSKALDEFETASGAPDPELRQLLADLSVTINERTEKTLQRQVFRRIHAILVRISA